MQTTLICKGLESKTIITHNTKTRHHQSIYVLYFKQLDEYISKKKEEKKGKEKERKKKLSINLIANIEMQLQIKKGNGCLQKTLYMEFKPKSKSIDH